MIEAVNSVLSNVQNARPAIEAQATTRTLAANPDKVQEAAPLKTPYTSFNIAFDRNYNKAIYQVRDSDTGDVLRQYPTKGQLRAYQDAQQISDQQERSETSSLAPSAPSTNEAVSQDISASSDISSTRIQGPQNPSVSTQAEIFSNN